MITHPSTNWAQRRVTRPTALHGHKVVGNNTITATGRQWNKQQLTVTDMTFSAVQS